MKNQQMSYEVSHLNKKLSLESLSRSISQSGGCVSPTELESWKVGDLLEPIIPNGITLSTTRVVRHVDRPAKESETT